MTASLGPERKRRKRKKFSEWKPLDDVQKQYVERVKPWCMKQAYHWAWLLTRREVGDPYRQQITEELFAGALLGAVYAASRFDPSRKCTFLTYAERYIFRELQKTVRGMAAIGDSFAYASGLPRELQTNGEPRVVSMSTFKMNDEGFLERLGECFTQRDDGESYTECDDVISVRRLVQGSMKTRDRKIIDMLFNRSMTLKDTGEVLGISKERVRQIRERILRNLRRRMETKS